MFIQLSRFGNTFGDKEPVFVNLSQVECFYSFLDVLGGKEVMVTKVQFNEAFYLSKRI
jgi:hypothetical protein